MVIEDCLDDTEIELQESFTRTDRFMIISSAYDQIAKEIGNEYDNKLAVIDRVKIENDRKVKKFIVGCLFSMVTLFGSTMLGTYNKKLTSYLPIVLLPQAVMTASIAAMGIYRSCRGQLEYSRNRNLLFEDFSGKRDRLLQYYNDLVDSNNVEYESRIQSYRINRRIREAALN